MDCKVTFGIGLCVNAQYICSVLVCVLFMFWYADACAAFHNFP